MKHVLTWVIIGLALVVVILLLLWPNPEPADTTAFKREIASQNHQIAVLSSELQKKAAKFKSDSVQAIKDSVEHKKHVSKLESRISQLKANPVVIRIREENPQVDSLIKAQDSLIVVSVQRVAVLEGEMFALRQDMSKVFTDCEARFQVQQEQSETKDKIIENQSGHIAKLERKERGKKIWRTVRDVITHGLAVLGGKAIN